MKPKHFIPTSSLFVVICFLISCADPVMDREIVAKLVLRNTCEVIIKPDSLDLVMRFIDKDTTAVIDADVYRRFPAGDSLFKLNLRLKQSDRWCIKDIRTKGGYSLCSSYCSDTLTTCTSFFNNARFGDFHLVTDTINMNLLCACD